MARMGTRRRTIQRRLRPALQPHRVVVYHGPGDDEQRLFLNNGLVGTAGYGQSRSFDLGHLDSSDVLRIDLWNGVAGYVYDARVTVDGTERYRARDGSVGSYGACGNAQGPNQSVVFRAILDFKGALIGGFRPC